MSSQQEGIERIRRLARQAELRMRFDRAFRTGARALCGALVVAIVAVALRKVGVLGESFACLVTAVAGAAVLVSWAIGWVWPLPNRVGARALDRFHGLHDRLASALSFADRPESSRTAFMRAAIDDAVAIASQARPRAAVRIGVPRSLAGAAGLLGVLAAVLLVHVHPRPPVVQARTIEPAVIAPDDLDDVRDFLKTLDDKVRADETKVAIAEFNQLVDDIANKRLDRTDAFRHIEMLDEKLLTFSGAEKKLFDEQIRKMGEELKKADLTKPVGDALAENQLERARDAMRDVAKKVREPKGAIDAAKLDQMRQALAKAAVQAESRRQELERRRQELADEILKEKEKLGDGGSDEERSLLEKKQRELDRLDRNVDEQRAAGRKLDRLDRELSQAAEDLMKELGASAEDLDRGAEDLNRMQQQEMTREEKEEIRQKLQELRQLLRQEGHGGTAHVMRLRRFGRMARGQGGSQEGSSGEEQGDGQSEGRGQKGEGRQGQGQPGGQGRGVGSGGETWLLGQNGEKMLMLSRGAREGAGDGKDGQGSPDKPWGDGHDPKLQGAATNPAMGTQDTQVPGADTGQGGSRSQVILGASERGFASRKYKAVYAEYHQVAEESLAKDEIPGGYRFYVKRYFQLIRPREER